MPRAPSYQPNQINPAETTGARFRAADNDGGVFGALGKGLQTLGQATGEYAVVQDKINEQYDDTQSRKLATEGATQISAITSEYTALQGGNAVTARPQTEAKIAEIHDKLIEQANNPRMRKMLEERLGTLRAAYTEKIGQHAIKELGVERTAAFKGQEAMFSSEAAGTSDPELRSKFITSGLAVTRDRLDFEGITDPTARRFEELRFTDGAHRDVMDRMLASADPDVEMVQAYMQAHDDEILPGTREAILKDLQAPLQARGADSDFQRALSGPVASTTGGGGAAGVAGVQALSLITAPTGSTETYLAKMGRAENASGDSNARNPRSSATGRYQFTDSTWLSSYKSHYGAAGLSDGQILAKRSDDDVQHVLATELTKKNEQALRSAGIPVNDGTRYLAHFAGSGGAKALFAADPNAPVEQVLGAKVVAANPFLRGKSAADTIAWADRKMGGTASGGRSTEAPREWNKDDAYNKIDTLAKAEGWSFERTERTKRRADQVISRDEDLLNRQRRAAGDQAAQIIANLPDGLTSINQIPDRIRRNMDPVKVAQLQGDIRDRQRVVADKARSEAQQNEATQLDWMRRFKPDEFKRINPLDYQGKLSPEQFRTVLGNHLEANKPQAFDPSDVRGGITSEIAFQKTHGGVKLRDEDEVKIYDVMESQLQNIQKARGRIEKGDYAAAYQTALKTRPVTNHGLLWNSTEDKPLYERITAGLTPEIEQTIRSNWKGSRPPTRGEIITVYSQMVQKAR